MPEQIADDRTISGLGTIRMPNSVDKPRYVSLIIDVLRPPSIIYPSHKYYPHRQRYATFNLLRDGYVVGEYTLDYPRKRLTFFADVNAEILNALKCAQIDTLGAIRLLSSELALPPINDASNISSFANLNLLWDEAYFQCEQDTALQVRILWDIVDNCQNNSTPDKKPGPPPPPKGQTPAGQPRNDISPPYDSNDPSVPNPLDNVPPTTPGSTPCKKYRVEFTFDVIAPNGQVATTISSFAVVYGVVGDLTTPPTDVNGKRVLLSCQGLISSEQSGDINEACGPIANKQVYGTSVTIGSFGNANITTITEVP